MTALEKSPWSFKHRLLRERRAQEKNTATAAPQAGPKAEEILEAHPISTWAEEEPKELILLKRRFQVLRMNY